MEAELDRVVTALRDPTRRAILLRFFEDPQPRTVDDVAEEAQIHRTVAFSHLEKLRALGYLSAESRRGARGKPARLYLLDAGPVELSHPVRRFQPLAELLVGALAGFGRRGRAAARKAGRGFRPQTRPAAGAGVREALEPLSDFGARYEVRGERIVAHNCVFVEACHDGIACEVQAGILEGALERAGVKGELKPEGREGGGCSYRLILKTED